MTIVYNVFTNFEQFRYPGLICFLFIETFITNVFEQLEKDFSELVANNRASFLVQKLVRLADRERMESVMKLIIADFWVCVRVESWLMRIDLVE